MRHCEERIEAQIRTELKSALPKLFEGVSNARMVEEMGVCSGKARADLAFICESLIGVEIKGPLDTLYRLPRQVEEYSKCFDQMLLVLDRQHLKGAMSIVPKWWGVLVRDEKSPEYKIVRQPKRNQNVDLNSVLGLLWRDEIAALVSSLVGIEPGPRESKRAMRQALISRVGPKKLKSEGLRILRDRVDWLPERAA
jgi:hypothetical protein